MNDLCTKVLFVKKQEIEVIEIMRETEKLPPAKSQTYSKDSGLHAYKLFFRLMELQTFYFAFSVCIQEKL